MSVAVKEDFDGFFLTVRSANVKALDVAATITQGQIQRLLSIHGFSNTQAKGFGFTDKERSSPPGSPPGLRTGTLRRSIQIDRRGLKRKNPFVRVGTNLVYGRIHELGGNAGRGGSARLPKRPYIVPGFKAAKPAAEKAITSIFRAKIAKYKGVA